MNKGRQLGAQVRRRQGGAAVVEFAILLPILMFLFMGTIDIGLAFNAGRQAEDTLRAAARLGAADGIKRPADYTVLRAIAAQNGGAGLGQPEGKIDRVVIYKATGTGEVPVACWTGSVADLCNSYQGSILDTLVSPAGFTNPNCAGDLDAAWCPTARRAAFDEGANLGVAIRVTRKPLLGEWNGESLGVSEITRRVVFRMEVRTES